MHNVAVLLKTAFLRAGIRKQKGRVPLTVLES